MAIQHRSPLTVPTGPEIPVLSAPANPEALERFRRFLPVVFLISACVTLVGFGAYATDLGVSAFDDYRALVFVHVMAVLISLGSTFALPAIQPMAARQGIPALRFTMKFAAQLSSKVTGPGMLLVIASGVGLILSDLTGYRYDLPVWLIVAMVWVGLANIIAVGFESPTLRRIVELLDGTPDEGPPPEELVRLGARQKLIGQVLACSTVGVLFLMAWRPEF